jgi:hypothetical protein
MSPGARIPLLGQDTGAIVQWKRTPQGIGYATIRPMPTILLSANLAGGWNALQLLTLGGCPIDRTPPSKGIHPMTQPPGDTFSLADVLVAVKVMQDNNAPPGPSGHYELSVHPRSVTAFMQQRRDRGDDFIAEHGIRAWYRRATRRHLPPRGGPPPA